MARAAATRVQAPVFHNGSQFSVAMVFDKLVSVSRFNLSQLEVTGAAPTLDLAAQFFPAAGGRSGTCLCNVCGVCRVPAPACAVVSDPVTTVMSPCRKRHRAAGVRRDADANGAVQ
jgi:hypothetical protein